MTHKEALAIKKDFVDRYLRAEEPRVDSVGLGIDQETRGFCLLAHGSEQGMNLLPDTFRGLKVIQRVAGLNELL